MRGLAQAALGPAERLIAAAGFVEFPGDAKVVPATVIQPGGDRWR